MLSTDLVESGTYLIRPCISMPQLTSRLGTLQRLPLEFSLETPVAECYSLVISRSQVEHAYYFHFAVASLAVHLLPGSVKSVVYHRQHPSWPWILYLQDCLLPYGLPFFWAVPSCSWARSTAAHTYAFFIGVHTLWKGMLKMGRTVTTIWWRELWDWSLKSLYPKALVGL